MKEGADMEGESRMNRTLRLQDAAEGEGARIGDNHLHYNPLYARNSEMEGKGQDNREERKEKTERHRQTRRQEKRQPAKAKKEVRHTSDTMYSIGRHWRMPRRS